jgi:hypothetical protein
LFYFTDERHNALIKRIRLMVLEKAITRIRTLELFVGLIWAPSLNGGNP